MKEMCPRCGQPFIYSRSITRNGRRVYKKDGGVYRFCPCKKKR